MNKRKLLFENFIIYGFGQIIYKIIPIITLPIITRIMPDSSFYLGYNDLATTLISLVSIIGLMGQYDAVFRLFFDYENSETEKRIEICSTAVILSTGFSTCCVLIILMFYKQIGQFWFEDGEQSALLFLCCISILATNISNLVMTPTRILNQRRRFITGNVGASIIAYSISIYMVCKGNYMLAMPMGALLSQIFNIIYYGFFNHRWFSFTAFRKECILPLLKIGIPLMPTFLIFWIYSSFDRIMILKMLGVHANGLLAVAGKLAQISQLLTMAFATGWSYYNFATMKDKKHVEDFSKIINYYVTLGFFMFALCRLFGDFLMSLFFTENYASLGSTFAYLFLAPIVNSIFQLMGSQFLIIKKTLYSSIIAATGVTLNLALNIVLIHSQGIKGAAMATVASYFAIVVIAALILYKKKMFYVYKCTIGVGMLLIGVMAIDFKDNAEVLMTMFLLLAFILIGVLFRRDIQSDILRLKETKKIKGERKNE